jgi:drug/metabolite transporter (DMT)-like permease
MKKGLLYILLTAIIFTTFEPVSKLISSQINPVSMTFVRFLIGGLILLPFGIAKIRKNNIVLNKTDYITMILLGTLNICVSMVLLQYAVLKADSPALIAIIFSSNSVFTILFAALILKDKITPLKLCAILLCVTGVLIGAGLKSGTNLLSVGLAVLSALSFSLYTVLSKKLMTKVTGIIQTGFSFISGSLILLVGLLFTKTPIVSSINQENILQLLYLGFIVTGTGYWFYFRAMEKSSAMAASLVFFIKPILTPFAAFFINGIVPDIKVFIALILVIAGSYLAVAKK